MENTNEFTSEMKNQTVINLEQGYEILHVEMDILNENKIE